MLPPVENSESVKVPATSPTKGRRSIAEGIERRLEIRRLVRLKLRQFEIARRLKVSPRTVKHDMQIIRGEDREYLQQIQKEGFLHEFVGSLAFLQDRQRSLLLIEQDPSTHPADKIKAVEVNAQIEQQVLNYLAGFSAMLLHLPLQYAVEDLSRLGLRLTK